MIYLLNLHDYFFLMLEESTWFFKFNISNFHFKCRQYLVQHSKLAFLHGACTRQGPFLLLCSSLWGLSFQFS